MGFFSLLFGRRSAPDAPPSPVDGLPLLGELADVCPSCHAALAKRPQRKTKCKACGVFIYCKSRPQDRVKVLVTEADAAEIEEQWKIKQGFSGRPEYNVERKAELALELAKDASERNWGCYCGHLIRLAEIAEREGDLRLAAEYYGRSVYWRLRERTTQGSPSSHAITSA